jgi:uncharacterized protein YciI
MKFMNLCHYVSDLTKVAAVRPAHRAYMAELDQRGQLWAAGPLADGRGGLFIYEADKLEDAQAIFQNDPYFLGQVIETHELAPWDAALYKIALGSSNVPTSPKED